MPVLKHAEFGLEKGLIASWAEPRQGRYEYPRYGKRPFPAKVFTRLVKGVFLLVVFYSFLGLLTGPLGSPLQVVFVSIFGVACAFPVLLLLDLTTSRNVWLYSDRIEVSHGSERLLFPKTNLEQLFFYRSRGAEVDLMEIKTNEGVSTVVAFPDKSDTNEIVTALRAIDYPVRDDR